MESNIEKLKGLLGMKPQEQETTLSDADIEMIITESNSIASQDWMNSTMSGAGSVVSSAGAGGSVSITSGAVGGGYVFSGPTTGYTYTVPSTAMTGGSGYYSIGSGITFSMPPKTNIVSFNGTDGKEIVRINLDGSVTWADGIKIDEAAEAMARTMTQSTELQAGITKAVKLRMRDSVFEDLIGIAKQKGSLTAEDLTYLLEASKIVEKLKGAKD